MYEYYIGNTAEIEKHVAGLYRIIYTVAMFIINRN